MKSPNVTAGRVEKVTAGWVGGVNSVRNPWNLPADQLKWGVNITVRGGLAQTRPGQGMKLSLPPGNLQGGCFFASNKQFKAAQVNTTSGGTTTTQETIYNYDGTQSFESELPYILFAVGGSVYFAPFPLEQPRDWDEYKLTGISLDPSVSEFVFTVATQTSTLSAGGDVTVTPSNRVVIIQDGINSPGYWDGSNTTGAQDSNIPIGYWMAYSGNRLWVAARNIVLASDLGNPFSWVERTEGAGRGDFSFPRTVTALVDYVGQNNDTRLIVFTDRSTYSLASGVLDRSQWITTANFQNTLYPTVGCVAGKSVAFQAGLMWWYSKGGLVNANVASSAYLTSQVLFKDVEMARIKRLMPANTTGICATSFENYFLCSVPYLEPLPSATMVLDYAIASELNQSQTTPAWSGVWTGTRPIEWLPGTVQNQQRLFHLSVDYVSTNDGSFNHLWESFLPERVDSYLQLNPDGTATTKYNRIYCQAETALLGDGMELKQIKYGELDCTQIGGTVDLRVSYRGGKGTYEQILNTRLLAVTSDYQFENTPLADEIYNYGILRNQYRRVITESVQRPLTNSCESKDSLDVDKAFSFLIEWCGELGVEAARMFMDPWQEISVGKPQRDELKSCVVHEDGSSNTVELLPTPYEQPSLNQQSWFATESQTITLNCDAGSPTLGVSATATASAESFVSLADAKQKATTLAAQAASAAANKFRKQNPC
jgi:hypothetical protein